MTTINANTKKAAAFWAAFKNATATSLAQVYETYSLDKKNAEKRCREKMEYEGGRYFTIMGANTFGFSCGWVLPDGSLRVETRANSYVVLA